MAKKLQAVRGMKDTLPDSMGLWHRLETVFRETASSYGYSEIRTPILEMTDLFKRSIGEVTDVVEKEMYTFLDRDELSLTLRPEGTASCVRACLEHGLIYNQTQRLWYMGPMFRHERPQKGRYRQFYQFGIEVFGLKDILSDLEVLLFARRVFKRLGVLDKVHLELNSLGDSDSRAKHKEALVAYFEKNIDKLDDDSKRRLKLNPLRILDSKNPDMNDLNENAPKLLDFLSDSYKEDFDRLLHLLDISGIDYIINHRLVRGLDYYSGVVFEWVTSELGSQGAVCAGGRYDGLAEELGGQATPACGFSFGMERLIELMKLVPENFVEEKPHVYLIMVGERARQKGIILSERLRQDLSNLKLVFDTEGGKFPKQFKRADKSGAEIALILGDNEVENDIISVKNLRADESQREFTFKELLEFLFELVKK